MKEKLIDHFTYWLSVIVIGLALGLFVQFVQAWVEPSASPPGGSLGAPLNTGALTQIKAGTLGINSNGNPVGLVVNGNVGIGTGNPDAKLHISGGIAITHPSIPYDTRGDAGGRAGIIFGANHPINNAMFWISPDAASGNKLNIGAGYDYSDANSMLTIDVLGNVGIGTAGPEAKLDVKGKAKADDFCLQDNSKCLSNVSESGSGDVLGLPGDYLTGPTGPYSVRIRRNEGVTRSIDIGNHFFCYLTKVYLSGEESYTTGYCDLNKDASNNWTLEALVAMRGPNFTECEAMCMDKRTIHTAKDCTSEGGEVVSDGGGIKFCRFNRSYCPAGWLRYRNWSTTQPRTCSNAQCASSCTTDSHSWADKAAETCSYSLSLGGVCRNIYCSATNVQVGCY